MHRHAPPTAAVRGGAVPPAAPACVRVKPLHNHPCQRRGVGAAAGDSSGGWDAFTDTDDDAAEDLLSFIASRQQGGKQQQTSVGAQVGAGAPLTALRPAHAATPAKPHAPPGRMGVAQQPQRPQHLPTPGRPGTSKPPAPAASVFSDSDLLIQAYSILQSEVAVMDSLTASSTGASLGSSSSSSGGVSIGSSSSSSTKGAAAPAHAQPSPSHRPIVSFNQLKGRPYSYALKLRTNMAEAGYNVPTPIQRYSIPIVHAGRDLLATAHTGSGKTAAYLVPVLGTVMKQTRFKPPRNRCFPAALVLLPTRELALQTLEEARRLTRGSHIKCVCLAGGELLVDQVFAMRGGADVIVATPGRLMDHLARKVLKLDNVRLLVIDEADKMLGLGFEPELRRLVCHRRMPGPPSRQTLLLSATMPEQLRALAAEFLHHHVALDVGAQGSSLGLTEQSVEQLPQEAKLEWLTRRLAASPGQTLVFANTIAAARRVHTLLASRGLGVSLFHGDLPQALRDEAMTCFKFGVTSVMVCTGLAARGVDIPDVASVINFDAPPEPEDYIHRIGRTGRAGKSGTAVTLFTGSPADARAALGVVGVLEKSGVEVPAWLAAMADAAAVAAADAADAAAADAAGDPSSSRSSGSSSSTAGDGAASAAGAAGKAPGRSATPAAPASQKVPRPAAQRAPARPADWNSKAHAYGAYLAARPPGSGGGALSPLLARSLAEEVAAAAASPSATGGGGSGGGGAVGVAPRGAGVVSGSGGTPSGLQRPEVAASAGELLARWQRIIHGGRRRAALAFADGDGGDGDAPNNVSSPSAAALSSSALDAAGAPHTPSGYYSRARRGGGGGGGGVDGEDEHEEPDEGEGGECSDDEVLDGLARAGPGGGASDGGRGEAGSTPGAGVHSGGGGGGDRGGGIGGSAEEYGDHRMRVSPGGGGGERSVQLRTHGGSGFVLSIPVARGANWFLAGGGRRMEEEEATAAAAERIAAAAEDGTSLPVRLATDVVRFLYGGTGRRESADGGVVSASLLNAKPAVGGIGVEPRGGGVLRVLFTVASDAVADTVVRWRHELRRCVDSTAVFDVLSDREEAQHQALWPAFLAAKVAGKRAQFHRARLVVDGERVPAPAC
ncbi:hypothetical protein FOA52_005344 [Chlamydomonas sp. UWO 241]|nr:hypothetical protein FOA52_005344 [Chlamydomonas sp. UWO 241]